MLTPLHKKCLQDLGNPLSYASKLFKCDQWPELLTLCEEADSRISN